MPAIVPTMSDGAIPMMKPTKTRSMGVPVTGIPLEGPGLAGRPDGPPQV